MDKAITTALLIVISMVMALMLFNIAYPAVIDSGDAIANMANRAGERMRSEIEIIHAAGERDSSGTWHDNNLNFDFDVFVWVKNVGDMRVIAVDQMDIFFGPEGNFTRIPNVNDAGGSYPRWSWVLENSADFNPTTTLRIAITYGSDGDAPSGRYYMKVTTSSGVTDEYFVGI